MYLWVCAHVLFLYVHHIPGGTTKGKKRVSDPNICLLGIELWSSTGAASSLSHRVIYSARLFKKKKKSNGNESSKTNSIHQ